MPDPSLHHLYLKPNEHNPNPVGVGTELKRLIAKLGIHPTPRCKCNQRAMAMDAAGPDWCEQHIEEIVGWLGEEANNRRLPFVRAAGKLLVKLAIHNTRRKLTILNEGK
jgi:hypothetical protein